MFLHTPTFKKLLKASWKNGGITVGRLDSLSLFVAGDYWVTWFDYTSIPNRIRAAIIEYAGELPEIIAGWHNLYQIFQDKENHLIPVSRIYDDLIDRREQEECEGSVIGPSMHDYGLDYAPALYWYSNLRILGIMPVHLDNEDALKALAALSDTDFHKKEA